MFPRSKRLFATPARSGRFFPRYLFLILDLGRDRIYLTPRTDAPRFERDRAGIRFDLFDDRLKVTFVSPQGPAAAAGLKVGDEIVAVDGRQVAHDYYSRPDWVRGPAGNSILLTRADGTKAKVTLADYF